MLQRVRKYLTIAAAEKIFNMMIAPLTTYCCLVKMPLSQTQLSSLRSLEDRASQIIYSKENNKKVASIIHQRNTKSCLTVLKCINNKTCTPMKSYFEINEHNKSTRNQNSLLKLPRLRLELGRQTFSYSGAKIYNDLPTNLRKERNFSCFKRALKLHVFN